ncbi:DUF4097 family beta strand repeat-containing protein [Actinomycetospora atypica]|uniref:DUF4097 family beta strand repeat-containing protein n=1 Tax=Actinomycetospora atypica TaxID=1290095 RepID=A0ABV9YRV8_9PSEU
MPTFDTPDPITATVELPIGELRVIASDRPDTEVEVRSTPADRDVADGVRVEFDGGELRVTGPRLGLRKLLVPTPGRSLEVEIALPAGSALTATTIYGGIEARGRLGACRARCRYGDVRVEDAATADLAATYGQVRVSGTVTGDAALGADHGGVRVHRVGGAADLRTRHGAIRADEIGGPARLTGAHGDVEVDVAEDDVHARTSHGAVRLGRVARGEVSMTSTSGRLEVGVAPDSAAWLELASTTGRVSNALTPRDDPGGFAETVAITAHSRDGDIVVRRS